MKTVLTAALLIFTLPTLASDVHVRVDPAAPHANPGDENLTVFPTIQNALDHHPFATDGGRVFIEIVPGTYHERVIITQNHPNITLFGLGKSPEDVVITNSLNARVAGGTFFTETVEINGAGFEADNITFENAAGNTGQAVAVANRSDRSIFKHCRFLGHQDTLFADYGRQYYVDSYIEGGVDYIFGNATAVFERDELHSNGPGFITAQSRTSPSQPTGFVILNSRVTADLSAPQKDAVIPSEAAQAAESRDPRISSQPSGAPRPASGTWDGTTANSGAPSTPASAGLGGNETSGAPSFAASSQRVGSDSLTAPHAPASATDPSMPGYRSIASAHRMIGLGRPWRAYSRVIFINTSLPAEMNSAGWDNWGNPANEHTAYYAEFRSTGPGASPTTRVRWSHQLTAAEAKQYLPQSFLAGPKSGPKSKSAHWDPIAEAAKLP